MQLVVVSAAGEGGDPHWSTARAGELVRAVPAWAAEAGHEAQVALRWLAEVDDHSPPLLLPTDTSADADTALAAARAAGRTIEEFRRPTRGYTRVAENAAGIPVEVALTRALRDLPGATVLHVGLGARGTPNVGWIAERMGSPTFAIVKTAELTCARGDRVDRSGASCSDWQDPERCRWCCTPAGFWRRGPSASDVRNRADLIFASLQACAGIFVDDGDGEKVALSCGAAEGSVHIGQDVAGVLARLSVSE
ncbi:MAG: hypothetical protein AB8H80_05165 [Planctomycetota bacterium]